MPHHIVLAHGFLGWGDDALPAALQNLIPITPPQYFLGVAAMLNSHGHTVIAPGVPRLGSVAQRAGILAAKIRKCWPDQPDFHVIAHSMGGLDTRHILATDPDLASRIKTLIAIATPHLGSPVADAVLDRTSKLRPLIPAPLLLALQQNAGALEDLKVRAGPMDADRAGVKYVDVACDASQVSSPSPLFALTRAIGGIGQGEVNDGVVLRTSALCPGHKQRNDWPVDHCGAIGWPTGFWLPAKLDLNLLGPSPEHLQRYADLVAEELG
jgi:triacylglycerol esterase/lipase EstA (alpha/beta hydrolase family)